MKPQYILIDEDGDKFYFSDKEMTIYHREDGPAVEGANGHKEWWINDQRHREDGPAYEGASGHKLWYINGKLHREDWPAIEYADGSKHWYLNGKCHRADGPAVEFANGHKEWYLNGQQLTEAEFNASNKPSCEGKVVEIDGKKYKLIPA